MKAVKEHLLTVALILTIASLFVGFGYLVITFEEYVLFVVGGGLVVYAIYTMYNGFLCEVRRTLEQREYENKKKKNVEVS